MMLSPPEENDHKMRERYSLARFLVQGEALSQEHRPELV
jgi:hypothetical protein